MKRAHHLIEKIATKENLYLAFYKAARGKRNKNEVLKYEQNLDDNISALQNQLLTGDIICGHYHYFKIYDPKERTICAASFAERVLHHALMNICHPYFEKHFIQTTYATRVGKGTYAALNKAKEAMKKYEWVAKLDVRKYFDTIQHDILKNKLSRLFKDKKLLAVFNQIIDSYSCSEGKGIPIGNLTSQYFANYYLSAADHYCKEIIRAPVYIRYMDDMLIFAKTNTELKNTVLLFSEFIVANTQLVLKPILYRKTSNGLSFLGYKISSSSVLLNGMSKRRFIRKMKLYTDNLKHNKWNQQIFSRHVQPLISFTLFAQAKALRKRILYLQ